MSLKQLKTPLPQSEWFCPFDVENIPSSGKTVKMVAGDEYLKPIAERLQILELKNLTAECRLTLQNAGHILYISGYFKADIVQECVVTLQPVYSTLEDSFEAWYADHDKAIPFNRAKHQQKAMAEGDEVQILEEKDDPEPLVDGQVDLGELVIQFLSLAVNHYPRAEGVDAEEEPALIEIKAKSSATTLRPNPFAALKNWRPKD
jgi:uncharacterized metal-binding protein YceD (DUF177 family)